MREIIKKARGGVVFILGRAARLQNQHTQVKKMGRLVSEVASDGRDGRL